MPLAAACRDTRFALAGPFPYLPFDDLSSLSPFDVTLCWEANTTGAGVLQADAALDATPSP